ncbi:MAG: DUF4212 domain-containing protein [Rhodocyclaceae bacterium]|jgi:putative solute:sodium symporter small subunit|nr:DUF4212 domain-containing protein [Rhodocyclaceae bacterium]MBK6908567.1 DUF4212 domain-containing protein [Rhodocyclaceae bacterium]
MSRTPEQTQHWQANRSLSLVLLTVWFVVTFGVMIFADDLNHFTFIGPLGFYMAAQGSLLVYLAIIGAYAWHMRRIDERCHLDEAERE